jgi:hypothetical protein
MTQVSSTGQIMTESIRDALDHYSEVVNALKAVATTLFFRNDLDQDVDVQVEASYDEAFADIWNIGAPIAVLSGGGLGNKVIADFYPFYRLKVTPAGVPTSDAFNAWVGKCQPL